METAWLQCLNFVNLAAIGIFSFFTANHRAKARDRFAEHPSRSKSKSKLQQKRQFVQQTVPARNMLVLSYSFV